jgi:dihydroorotate dehydrogenase (NAD+) catalytic subunit
VPSTPAVFYDPTKTFDDNFDNGPFPLGTPLTKPGISYINTGEPGYTFLGHPLYAPFGIAAGSLPTSKHTGYAFERGFDVVCYKTQRSVPFPCNEFPNVLYLGVEGDLTLDKASKPLVGLTESDAPNTKLTITNSFGNPSRGPEFWVDDLKKAVAMQGKGQLLIASIVGTIQEGFGADEYYDDFAEAAARAVSAGVQAVELNLSCPNVATEGVICYTHDAVIGIAKKVKARVGEIPLIAKFGYFSDEQEPLLEQIIIDSAPYLAAISAINTISAPVVDENGSQALPGPNRLMSGCCGAGIKWAGLDMVRKLDSIRKKHNLTYEIIGVGGVMTPDDFKEYRSAGADVVQSVTGAMWNPDLAAEVKASL